VIIIEHNLDVIRNADWVIDLGPEGGEDGGRIVGEGRPAKIAATPGSYTGQFLKRYYKLSNGHLTPADAEEDLFLPSAAGGDSESASNAVHPDPSSATGSNGKRTRGTNQAAGTTRRTKKTGRP
jgi:excinuclease ABC subunit A